MARRLRSRGNCKVVQLVQRDEKVSAKGIECYESCVCGFLEREAIYGVSGGMFELVGSGRMYS